MSRVYARGARSAPSATPPEIRASRGVLLIESPRGDTRSRGGGRGRRSALTPVREIEVRSPGGLEALAPRRRELPEPGPGQVLVEVSACGVNFADLAVRQGLYSAVRDYPVVPGFEFAGRVAAAGPGVEAPRPGESVFGVTRFGGYADRILADAGRVWPLPRGWSLEQGAGFPAVFLTAWHAIRRVARLEPGETALVHSAAGGMGLAFGQLLPAWGIRAVGLVGSSRKAETALTYGYDAIGRMTFLKGKELGSHLRY